MAELILIIANDNITKITTSPMLVEGFAPQASPMISDPRFGSKNSALEIVPTNFKDSSIAASVVSSP